MSKKIVLVLMQHVLLEGHPPTDAFKCEIEDADIAGVMVRMTDSGVKYWFPVHMIKLMRVMEDKSDD